MALYPGLMTSETAWPWEQWPGKYHTALMRNGPQASGTAGHGKLHNGLLENAKGNGPGALKAMVIHVMAHATDAHGRQADITVVAHGHKQGLDQV